MRRQKCEVLETELVDKLILDLCFFLFKECGSYHATGFKAKLSIDFRGVSCPKINGRRCPHVFTYSDLVIDF